MTDTCMNCYHWERNVQYGEVLPFGRCRLLPNDYIEPVLIMGVGDALEFIETSENFGCILFRGIDPQTDSLTATSKKSLAK